VALLEAASPAAASVEIEDIEEEELLDWGDVEEAEDIEAAPLVSDGEDMDLMPGQAKEDPTPRSDVDMDATAASPRSSSSAGEGRVDASTRVPSSLRPTSAAPSGEPQLSRLKSIIIWPERVGVPTVEPSDHHGKMWRCRASCWEKGESSRVMV
jgi:hypothetical protein